MTPNSLARTLALAVAFVTVPLASAGAAAISDDFNDNTLDATTWAVINDGSGVSVAETGQRVEVTLAADAAGAFFGGYRSIATFSGDLDAEVSYSLLDWPAKNGVRVGLSLVTGWPPTSFWNVERVSGGAIEAFGDVYLTDYFTSIGALVPTADAAGRLRLIRQGNTLTSLYLQGSDWVQLRSETVNSGDVNIAFSAWSDDTYFGNQAVRVAFDDVTVVPLPGTLLGLATGVLALAARATAARRARSPQTR